MNRPIAVVALAFAPLAACEPREAAPMEPSADVQREAVPDGEVWRSTTRAPGTSRRTSWVTVREEVRLDREGHLSYADTVVRDDVGSPELRVLCEPREHRVVIERGGRRLEWTVPGDEPWILASVRGPAAEPIQTPLVAWTTWRATRNSEWVRLVVPLEQRTFVVPRDQQVVDRTVVVGDTSVEVDAEFVRAIRIGGVELSRAAGGIYGAFRFHGE